LKFEPPGIDAEQTKQFAGHRYYSGSFFITIQVMTVADVSAAYQDAIRAFLKGLQDEVGRNAPGTHHPDNPDIGRILDAADPGKVSAGVCAPVAAKSDYFRLEIRAHLFSLSFKIWRNIQYSHFKIPPAPL
jgi:hypothetical protein